MNLDDQICYCYHVPLRKLLHFARREQPVRASQMSNCLGAGTGCGWCIPILIKIYEKARAGELDSAISMTQTHPAPAVDAPDGQFVIDGLPESPAAYASARKEYLHSDDKNSF